MGGTVIHTDTTLLRLLQLSSAALPVGGYAFSQGMEMAVEKQWLTDADSTRQWLAVQLQESLARVDLPLLRRQYLACAADDSAQLCYWNATCLACRETSELRLADVAMGQALVRLCGELGLPLRRLNEDTSFVTVFAQAAQHWQIDTDHACQGFAWSWLENQVAAAVKLVPLGQSAAQRLLGDLLPDVSDALATSAGVADGDIGGSLPALALASGWHETQYSRLFRS